VKVPRNRAAAGWLSGGKPDEEPLMAKPPASPPSSDIDGVHQDGMRPSKPLDTHGQDSGDLEEAGREDAARPNYSNEESTDDRSS
jgi:hypothetical protein